MSFRLGMFPSLLRSAQQTAQAAPRAGRAFHFMPSNAPRFSSPRFPRFNNFQPKAVSVARSAPRQGGWKNAYMYAVGLGVAAWTFAPRTVRLDAAYQAPPVAARKPVGVETGPPVESSVNLTQLTFGTVCGICAGVFVKKGFKALAFLLGGVFVLLQVSNRSLTIGELADEKYLQSKSFVKVDWAKVNKSYDGLLGTVDDKGAVTYPTVQSVFQGFVDFLTANFQRGFYL